MKLNDLRSFCVFYSLHVSISSAWIHDQRQHRQARDILSPVESLADSVLGITTTETSQQTAAAASTTSQTATPQNDSATTATPQVVTVVRTAAATSASSEASVSEMSSATTSGSAATSTIQSISASSARTLPDHSTSQTPSTSSAPPSSTPATPANPVQDLSSSSSGSSQERQDEGNTVPAAGVAVAIVFGVLILAGAAYLFYRHFADARRKASARKSTEYNEVKRSFYFQHDTEQATVDNPGLGLGKVAELRNAPDSALPNNVMAYRTRSRASSADTLVSQPSLPISPLDRREYPLPQLPRGAQESWPIISPVDALPPGSFSVMRPAPPAPRATAVTGYIPYRREADIVIGLAVPLSSSHMQAGQGSGHTLPEPVQRHEIATLKRARRISGVHELL